MISSFMQGSTSILALVAIPIGFLLTLIWYFINRYINNTTLRYVLTFGTMGIFMSRFTMLMKEYKNIQPLSKLNFIFIIVIFIGISALCINKNYEAYSMKE